MRSMWKTISVAVPLVLALLVSCKSDSPTGPGANAAILSGQVTQAGSGPAIAGATVGVTYQGTTFSGNTDATGNYSVTVSLMDTLPVTVSVTVSASGYQTTTQNVLLQPNQTTDADFQLSLNTTPVPPPPPGGGYANTIAFVGVTTDILGIYGVGGTLDESAVITFEARDSLGSPILPARADTMAFSISGVPVTGGAYITPTSGLTNTAARVSTVIQSGTVPGSIQVVASLTRETDGAVIRSTPVKIIIYGGLPDQAHFGLAASRYNVPGYYWQGRTSVITALVGDRFGNPVQPGTAVAFNNPQQGIITTDAFTDGAGFANATLSTSPVTHTASGLGWIYAETVGENGVRVRDSLTVLFSGNPILANVTGGPFTVDNTTQATITFNVWDERLNPLSAGTTIATEVEGPIKVSKASPANTLTDVISPFWTSFSVVVSKDLDATGPFPATANITITVSHPENGTISQPVSGVVN